MSHQQTEITGSSSKAPRGKGQEYNRKTVLAIASAGGHWIQLRRLHPSFSGTRLIYATTQENYREEVEAEGSEFRVVPDCNRWEKLKLIKAAFSIFRLILNEKPDAIISTGAAPGYFAIRIGKLLGKKTIWVDSIANAEELSLSGKKAGKHVKHWITQWEHLAEPTGPHFFGNVIGDTEQTSTSHDPDASPSQTATDSQNPAISKSSTEELSYEGSSSNEHCKNQPIRVFVTVGTDLPFDRLIRSLDDWATAKPQYKVFAQIGRSEYKPKNIAYTNFLAPSEFRKHFSTSDFIVSHAGMGTILSSLSSQKPLIVMPRIAAKGEHRNEHQLATARHLQELGKVNVANNEVELLKKLDTIDSIAKKDAIGPFASETLCSAIRRGIG